MAAVTLTLLKTSFRPSLCLLKDCVRKKNVVGICGGAEDNGGIRHSIGGLGVGGSRLDWSLRCCVVSVLLIVSDHNYPGWNRTITRAVHVGNWP